MTAPSAGQTFFQDVSVKVEASSQKPFDPSHRKSRYARPSSKEWRLYAYGGRGNARLRTNLASIYQVPTYDGAMNISPDAQYADYSRKMSELQSTRLGVQFIRTLSRNQRWFVSTGFEYQQWERRLQYYHNRSPRNQNLAFFDYQPHHHLGYDVAQKQTTNRYRFASVPLMIGYRLPAWGALQIDCSLGAGYQYLADALGMEYHFYYEEFQQEDTRSQEIYRSHSFHGRSGININYTLSNWVDLRAGVQYQHAFQSLYERHYPIDLHIDPITWEFGVSHRL